MSALSPIVTLEDHAAAKARLHELMECVTEPGTPDAAELEALAVLIAAYEEKAFPIAPPSFLAALEFRMEQMGYSQSDLARLLGSRSRASEILSGKLDHLSLSMIRKLHNAWGIPAEALIREAA